MDEVSEMLSKAEELYVADQSIMPSSEIQMLCDLGYVNVLLLIDPLVETKVTEALQTFWNDYVISEFADSAKINRLRAIYGENFNIKILEEVTDIDEGLKIKKVPQLGERNLVTRIIHFRLALLGLYDAPVELSFNALSYAALEKAANYIDKPKLDTINLLSDFQAYTKAFLIAEGHKNSIVVFKAEPDIDRKSFPEYSGKFKRQLKSDLSEYPEEFDILNKKIFFLNDNKVDEEFLISRESDEINTFILRLIQVHQWMSGHYTGALDSSFGKKTISSLVEVIKHYNETSQREIDKEAILVCIKENHYIFNCMFFLNIYKEESHLQDKTYETLNTISDVYQKADVDEKEKFETNFHAAINEEKKQLTKIPEKVNGTIRRVFFGVKTFFRKVFRFAKNIFKWIIEGISSIVKNTVRMIYSFLKDAVQHFIAGVKFLLGKQPTITQGKDLKTNYSNFDTDKDGINLFGSKNPSEIKAHIEIVWTNIHSMRFSLSVISFLFNTIKGALSVVGWPLFAIKLVISFKQVIESYKTI